MGNIFLSSLEIFAPTLNIGTVVAIILLLLGIFGYSLFKGLTIAIKYTTGKKISPVLIQVGLIFISIILYFVSNMIENIVYSSGTWIIVGSIVVLVVAFILIFGDDIFGKKK